MLRGGVGYGGGISFDPVGAFPVQAQPGDVRRVFAGGFGTAGVGLGPAVAQFTVEAGAGARLNSQGRPSGGLMVITTPMLGIQPGGLRLGVTAAAGVEGAWTW